MFPDGVNIWYRMMGFRSLLLMLMVTWQLPVAGQALLYELKQGTVQFYSDALQELIHASSDGVEGLLDISTGKFAIRVGIASFKGFNNPLQRTHFNENYMESEKFPVAVYSGKIIEDIDLSREGVYWVRTKGKLTIHGVTQERIIKTRILSGKDQLTVDATFPVLLSEHDIKVPRIVYNKLAQEIRVSVNARFVLKS